MLSRFLVDYIVYVRPFLAMIAKLVYGLDAMHEYLYRIFTCRGVPLKTEDFSSALSSLTSPHPSDGGIGMGVMISSWRQLATAIWHSEAFFPYIKDLVDPSDEDFLPDLQAGHTSQVASQHYGIFSNRVAHIESRKMTRFSRLSGAWIWYFNLEREVPGSTENIWKPTSTDSSTAAGSETRAVSVSSGLLDFDHAQVLVSRMISSLTPVIINSARESAAESAAVLLKQSSPSGKSALFVDLAMDIQVSASLLTHLRRVLGEKDAHFRSPEQAQAVQYALERRGNLLVVLPTGAGKSLIFLIPMLIGRSTEDVGVNILIVPYNIMKEDMRRRCFLSSLDAELYHPEMSIEEARKLNCIICVADTAGDDRFHVLLKSLCRLGSLRRIYIDEAHHVLSSNVFRPVFTMLCRLRDYSVPLILLSATMPPSSVEDLMKSLSISSLKVFRRPSWRPELFISVTNLPCHDPASNFLDWVDYYRRVVREGERILIFCQTKNQVEELADLQPLFNRYHSGMSALDQNRAMGSFLSTAGSSNVMVSTTALGNGINIPDLCVVLHYGAPYSMTDYIQESGRGARNGAEGVSHVFVHTRENDYTSCNDGAIRGVEEIRTWLTTEQLCRRSLPHQVMDGIPITCTSLPSAVFCDICRVSFGQKPVFRSDPKKQIESADNATALERNTVGTDTISITEQFPPIDLPVISHVQQPSSSALQSTIVTATIQDLTLQPTHPHMAVLIDQHIHTLTTISDKNDHILLKELLSKLKADGKCIACWAKGVSEPEHRLKCFGANRFAKGSPYMIFKSRIKLQRHNCYLCAVPQVSPVVLFSFRYGLADRAIVAPERLSPS